MNRPGYRRQLPRTVRASFLIACLLLISSISIGANADARWDLKSLHPEVRARVHLRASEVPRFPHEDRRLMDPRRWPKTMTIQGRRCVLIVETVVRGRSAMRRTSIDAIGRGLPYTLFYTPADNSSRQLGPVYFWDSPKHLVDRRWIESSGMYWVTYEYGYHDTGALFRYAVGKWRKKQRAPGIRAERFSEFFDRKGRLVGAGYSHVDSNDKTTEVYYKDGKRISYPAFERDAEVPSR